jgi:aspartate aminotransferase-like enzyme
MEAAIVNFLSPGDKVLSLNIGAFGNRFAKIARAYGADVDEVKYERGKAVDLKTVEQKLSEDKDKKIKAVLIQQNETSTGVLNDVKSVAGLVNRHGALIIVDAVSGLLTAPLKVDEWGLDVVVSGSQKAFMVPPGLAFVSVNKKAWAANETARMPRFYFDFKQAMKFAEIGETPWTPAVSVIYGMQEAIRMLKEEGLENIFMRHEKGAKAVRAGLKALGLKLLVTDESIASKAVTPVFPPDGIEADKLRKTVREKYGVVLAGGQEDLKGKLFRIGHLGYIDKMEILAALSALEIELGSSVKKGAGVAAAEEVLA